MIDTLYTAFVDVNVVRTTLETIQRVSTETKIETIEFKPREITSTTTVTHTETHSAFVQETTTKTVYSTSSSMAVVDITTTVQDKVTSTQTHTLIVTNALDLTKVE